MHEAEAIQLLDEEWVRLTEARNRLEWQHVSTFHDHGDLADSARELVTDEEHTLLLSEISMAIDDVRHAYERLQHNSYGRCEACGESIGDERLRAQPAARYCVHDAPYRSGFATA